MPTSNLKWLAAMLCAPILDAAAVAGAPHPVPTGTSRTTVTWDTAAGPVSYHRDFGYEGPGASVADIRNIGGAPNVGGFIAFNDLGRRSDVVAIDPSVQAPNETLMRHGFYKAGTNDQVNRDGDFFDGIDVDGDVTITVTGITFDRPVQVREDTVLLHLLWDIDQVDQLGLDPQGFPRAYNNPHNHHTVTSFRDVGSFFLGATPVFTDVPISNYVLGDIAPSINQVAADTIDVSVTFPYRLLAHLEDDGLGIPDGVTLPAPGGFLEPWHLHLEYLVVPEPSSLGLLLAGGILPALRRRTR